MCTIRMYLLNLFTFRFTRDGRITSQFYPYLFFPDVHLHQLCINSVTPPPPFHSTIKWIELLLRVQLTMSRVYTFFTHLEQPCLSFIIQTHCNEQRSCWGVWGNWCRCYQGSILREVFVQHPYQKRPNGENLSGLAWESPRVPQSLRKRHRRTFARAITQHLLSC